MFGFSYAGLVYFGHGRTIDIYIRRENPDLDGLYKRVYDGMPIIVDLYNPANVLLKNSFTQSGEIESLSLPDVKIYKNNNKSSGDFTRVK